MPNDQPEPLAAILAEMREYFDLLKRGLIPDNVARMTTRQRHQFWADRVEAAAARERDEDRLLAAIAESDEAFARCARCDRPEHAWAGVCAACAEGTPPERCVYYGDPNGCNAPNLGKHPEGNLAERLQEALEKAERRIAELERAPGNASAMREALQKISHSIWSSIDPTCNDDCCAPKRELARLADAALSAPARNCDVGTAQEQIDRFNEFCHSNRYYIDEFHGDDCRPDCPIWKIVDRDNKFCDNCWAAWEQMPFATAEGGAK